MQISPPLTLTDVLQATLYIERKALAALNKRVDENARRACAGLFSQDFQSTLPQTIIVDNSSYFGSSSRTTLVSLPNAAFSSLSIQERRDDKEKKEANNAIIAGVIALFAMAISLPKLRKGQAKQNESLGAVVDVLKRTDRSPSLDPSVASLFKILLDHQVSIEKQSSAKLNNYVWCSFGALAAAISLVVGGFMMVPALMTAGYITLIASLIFSTANCSSHWSDKSEALEIYQKITDNTNGLIAGVKRRISEVDGTIPTAPPLHNDAEAAKSTQV
jgi:hypothetical protein